MLMGMKCGDEKIVVISSTPTNNEWPQHYNDNNNNIIHMISSNEHQHQQSLITTTNMASSSAMDQKPAAQDNLQALKCPRCESGNTKFCYYNNYSLSQPRHFCKACKRYWTRGGTLRNVPVGGGCRKNKRIRRPSSSSAGAATTTTTTNCSNSASLNSSSSSSNLAMNNSHASTNSQPPHIDLLSAGHGSHHIASLFYNHELTLPTFSRYDHLVQLQPPQLSGLGLGFSANGDSGLLSSNSLLSSYASIFGTPPAPSQLHPPPPPPPTTTTIASLLASKFTNKDQVSGAFQALTPFEELSIAGVGDNKEVKLELEAQRKSALGGWINNVDDHRHHHHQNQTDQIGLSTSSDLYWTNPTAVAGGGGGNWHDPTANIGSNSVPSLI